MGLLSRLVVPTGTKGPRSLLSRLELATGTKVPPFVPVGASNRDKRSWAPYPLPSPPARAIQLTCFLCSWLGIEEGLMLCSGCLLPDASACLCSIDGKKHKEEGSNLLLQIGPFVPVPKSHLFRFWNWDSAAGTKALEAFVPGGRTGTKYPSR